MLKQNFSVPKERKEIFGEVTTDFELINIMLDMLPNNVWGNKGLRWLDVGCGQGYFSYLILNRLLKSLQFQFKNTEECRKHIITNMLYMIEINPLHKPALLSIFGENSNILIDDFIDPTKESLQILTEIDIIIGNPPYNINGVIKTPTNSLLKKTLEGRTVWRDFLLKGISYLKTDGILSLITPSIWFRIDRNNIHNYILENFYLMNARCFTADETFRLFHKNAQTPTVIYTIQKSSPEEISLLWDSKHKNFIEYPVSPYNPLPLDRYSLFKSLLPSIKHYGHLNVVKTNSLSNLFEVSSKKTNKFRYKCVKTCYSKGDIVYEYTNKPTIYHNKKKIIMANKMYGRPMLDVDGTLGVSTRDNYIIFIDNVREMSILKNYINSEFVQTIFDCFRYRMRYLEKEAFLFVPDILAYIKENKGNKSYEIVMKNYLEN
jgi:hypothetical protein